jgi:hypothetical protein
LRRYFILITKKCRIYAAFGVSQTPKSYKQKKEKIKRCIMYQTARKSADIMNVKNAATVFCLCRR